MIAQLFYGLCAAASFALGKLLWDKLKNVYNSVSVLNRRIGELESQLQLERLEVARKETENARLQSEFEKLRHQKISSDVKTGFKLEQIAPLIESFPCKLETLKFLGQPIDYISFDYESETITFIEVKSGQSQLNANQLKVRKMIKEKRVEFVEYRIDEKGSRVK